MTKPTHTPGPYIIKAGLFVHGGESGTEFVCTAIDPANAERIAYCLTVVEQSEETARRDEAKS